MDRKKTATIRDVARVAGVSPATVSRFTNGSLALPDATANRIRAAIRDLDYRPNVLAKSFSLGQSRTLGLVVPDIVNPFFAQLASAAEREASDHGYHLILCSTESDPERELAYLKHLQVKRLDGIVFVTEHAREGPLTELVARTENLVLVDEDVPGFTGRRVFSDNQRGGALATQHLLGLGHRRIAYIGGPPDLMSAQERLAGHLQAMKEHGIHADARLRYDGPYRQATGREALRAFLEASPRPTAVFAASDATAIGVLSEARARGIRVPHDLSLVGFDGISITEMLYPALTTVKQRIEELGRFGVQALVGILNGTACAHEVERLPVELVVRESTCPPDSIST